VREAGINAEIFPDSAKLKKQLAYANSKYIPYVAMTGENEISQSIICLRNMATGEQKNVTLDEMIKILELC